MLIQLKKSGVKHAMALCSMIEFFTSEIMALKVNKRFGKHFGAVEKKMPPSARVL